MNDRKPRMVHRFKCQDWGKKEDFSGKMISIEFHSIMVGVEYIKYMEKNK